MMTVPYFSRTRIKTARVAIYIAVAAITPILVIVADVSIEFNQGIDRYSHHVY